MLWQCGGMGEGKTLKINFQEISPVSVLSDRYSIFRSSSPADS